MFVHLFVVAFFDLSTAARFDASFRLELLATFADRIRIVSGVGKNGTNLSRLKFFEQPLALWSVSILSGGQEEVDQLSARTGCSVDFRR